MTTMTVYIEYAFLDNLIIDFTLLKFSLLLSKHKVKFWWLLFCSFLCAVFALIIPVLPLDRIIKTILKIIFSLLIVFVLAKFEKPKDFFKLYAVFFGLTFICGGVIQGIFNLFSLPIEKEYFTWLIILGVKLLLNAIKFFVKIIKKSFQKDAFTYSCFVKVNGRTKKCLGFYDTGNGVLDSETGKGVVICSKKLAYNLLGTSVFESALSIKTATGSQEFSVFTVDKLIVNNKEYYQVKFAVSPLETVSDLLLHYDYLGE